MSCSMERYNRSPTIKYNVFAFGKHKDSSDADYCEFLGQFVSPRKAIEHANKFKDVSYVYNQDTINNYLDSGDFLEITVEAMYASGSNTTTSKIYSKFIF